MLTGYNDYNMEGVIEWWIVELIDCNRWYIIHESSRKKHGAVYFVCLHILIVIIEGGGYFQSIYTTEMWERAMRAGEINTRTVRNVDY